MTSRSMEIYGGAPPAPANWSKLVNVGLGFVVSVLGVFFLWAFFARLDGAAVAQGTVSVESSRKTVQHLEGGIVRDILVRDGVLVQKGAVLIRLDPTRIDSASELYRTQLAAALAQEARLLSEREMKEELILPAAVTDVAYNPVVARAIEDQQRQFTVKRESVLQAVQVAAAQIAQAVKEAEQNDIDHETAKTIAENLKREVEGVQYLFDRNLVALPRLTGLQRELSRVGGVIANTEAGKVRLQDKIHELTVRRDQVAQNYRQDAAAQLGDLQKSIAELRQQSVVANDSQQRVDIRAPITGVVQQMRIFTVGGVARPGDPLLDIVPTSDDLLIRARVSPLDADRVTVDMTAEVRFPSFRALGLPVISGRVAAISRDRLLDDMTKEPYFDAQISVGRKEVPVTIAEKLSAGMPAEVVIPTGERTVMNYLVAPVTERFYSSMRER
jgi:HlyD family type I secretion membrane fusion protein